MILVRVIDGSTRMDGGDWLRFALLAVGSALGLALSGRYLRRILTEPDLEDVVLTARGVRVGDRNALIEWDAIMAFDPTIDVERTGKTDSRIPRIHIRHLGDPAAIDVNKYRQHPVAMLNILEFYRQNQKQRVEIGMEASVLRARRITNVVEPRSRR